jgi:hypothetical protein
MRTFHLLLSRSISEMSLRGLGVFVQKVKQRTRDHNTHTAGCVSIQLALDFGLSLSWVVLP